MTSPGVWIALSSLVWLGALACAAERPTLWLDDAALSQMRQRVAAQGPEAAWAAALIREADAHRDAPRPSVVGVGLPAPSGDVHAFWTQLPYQHGDAQRDGVVNPAQDRADYQAAIRLGRAVRELGLAYRLTGELAYAKAARDYVRVWCVDPATAMSPRFTNDQSRIELCITLPGMFYGLDLIWDAPVWEPHERDAVQAWAGAIAEAARTWDSKNNFGNWRVVLLASAGAVAGDDRAVDEAFAAWRRLLDRQIDDRGFLPEELRRSKSLFYSTYALNAMVQGAELARRRGVDLYGYTSPRGRNLLACLRHHAPWIIDPRGWPGPQIEPYAGENAALYEVAWAATGDPLFQRVVQARGRPLHEPRVLGPVSLTYGGVRHPGPTDMLPSESTP